MFRILYHKLRGWLFPETVAREEFEKRQEENESVGGILIGTPKACIQKDAKGRFVLYHRGTTINTYSRRRDAVRGAERLGYSL